MDRPVVRRKAVTQSRRERGVVFLLLVGIVFLGAAALFLGTRNLNSAALDNQRNIAQNLQKAKQSLIAYAVNYADHQSGGGAGFGHFPCPDTDNNGSPQGFNCAPNEIGRLAIAWETNTDKAQVLYPFAEDAPRRFWYVTSQQFRPVLSADTRVNPDTLAELSVDGLGDIVAVVIDPGPPLTGQDRPSNDPADYLEGGNEDGDTTFFTSSTGEFNDRVIFITRDEIMPLVNTRVLYYVFQTLEAMDDVDPRFLPYAAFLGDTDDDDGNLACIADQLVGFLPVDFRPSTAPDGVLGCDVPTNQAFQPWVRSNQWHHHIYYQVDPNCTRITGCNPGAVSIEVTNNGVLYSPQSFMVAMFGSPLGAQDRSDPVPPDHSPADYLDSVESGDGDLEFVFEPLDANNNDVALSCHLRTGVSCLCQMHPEIPLCI
ncbi:MAG: hypothetical protein AAF420_02355 [Pseudomonadota bacterium]